MPREEMSISCIVCAYNEERAIRNTLNALRDVRGLHEIIVVDDGSKDRTAEIVREYPFCRLISLHPNGGKSHAFAEGFRASSGSYIMMLDADLVGLTAANIESLIAPVASGKSAASMSLRGNSLLIFRLIGLEFVSGERVFPRSLLADHIDSIGRLPGFGLESYINDLLVKARLSFTVVFWKNVHQERKSEKVGLVNGTLAEFRMLRQINKTIPFYKLAKQNLNLLRLKR